MAATKSPRTQPKSEVVAERDPGARLGVRRHQNSGGWSVGPCTYLANERQRLAGLHWPLFDVVQQGVTVGGEIVGVDLTTELPQAVIDELRRALFEFKVIFFRDQ